MHSTKSVQCFVSLAILTFLLFCPAPIRADGAENFDLLLFMPAVLTPPLSRDSDGDGLPDRWELQGYTQNGVFVNLPALGANPWRKDIFVWMDYMVTPGSTSLAPPQSVINNIIAVFNNAPVANPNGTTGITIHPILKNQVPYVESLGVSSNDTQVWTDFDVLKNASFTAAYAPAFRYMIWANTYNQDTSSGLARDIPSTDFMVTLGGWGTVGGTDWQKLGTFIHELGHCLGLTHGGSDHESWKPNYLSVMNYFFQTSGLYKDGHWGQTSPGYPLNFDYQRLNTPSLNKAALQEGLGLSGADNVSAYGTMYWYNNGAASTSVTNASLGIDWNKNNVIDALPVSADIDNSGSTTDTLTAQNNWPNVNYSANGQIGPNAGVARLQAARLDTPQELKEELNWTTQQRLDQTGSSKAKSRSSKSSLTTSWSFETVRARALPYERSGLLLRLDQNRELPGARVPFALQCLRCLAQHRPTPAGQDLSDRVRSPTAAQGMAIPSSSVSGPQTSAAASATHAARAAPPGAGAAR